MKTLEGEKTTARLVAPDGSIINKPTVVLDTEEAALLRKYKTFLRKHGIREAVYCNACWEGNRDDGMKAFVRDDRILWECRCRTLFHQGQSY